MRDYVRKSFKLGKNTWWVFKMSASEYFIISLIFNTISLIFSIIAFVFLCVLYIVAFLLDVFISLIMFLFGLTKKLPMKVRIILYIVMAVLVIAGVSYLAIQIPKINRRPKNVVEKSKVEDVTIHSDDQNNVNKSDSLYFDEVPDTVKTEFLFWDSDRRYLTESEVVNLDSLALQLAINEIYARHGRIWKDENWNSYFLSKSWYKPLYDENEFDISVFNDFEKKNVELLASHR